MFRIPLLGNENRSPVLSRNENKSPILCPKEVKCPVLSNNENRSPVELTNDSPVTDNKVKIKVQASPPINIVIDVALVRLQNTFVGDCLLIAGLGWLLLDMYKRKQKEKLIHKL
jgi:hypothetical protein